MLLFKWLKTPVTYLRKEAISTAVVRYQEAAVSETENTEENPNQVQINKRLIVPVETSIRYMKSDAYKKTYGDEPVWTHYRRNFRGPFPPDTRKSCIRFGKIATGSPCPICRDEYLVVDYENLDLIKQFISPHGGDILPTKKTGVCQVQHRKLLVAIKKAQNRGLIKFHIPHRRYDYKYYEEKMGISKSDLQDDTVNDTVKKSDEKLSVNE